MTELKQAVCYYRVSPDKYEQSIFTIEVQKVIVHNYCKQEGYQIVSEFEEIISDTEENKPILSDTLKITKEKDSTLIVTDLDRILCDSERLVSIRDSKIKFITVHNPIPIGNEMYDFTLNLMVSRVIHDRLYMNNEVKNAMIELKIWD